MKAQWILIVTLIFALLTAIFAVINVEPVRVNFVFSEPEIPLILIILGSTLLGGLIAAMLGMIRAFKLTRTIKQLEKRLAETASAELSPAPSPIDDPPAPLPEGLPPTDDK